MSIVIFIIILGILIFVHELGHFITAKKSGIRVDEFAIGFPPKIFSFKKGGTDYSLNLIPFGGYVRIFGENPDEESLDPNAKDSFVNKSKWTQAMILVAGVLFNILFAWLLFSVSFMTGFPSVVTEETKDDIVNANVVVTDVFENSPASQNGLMVGDEIIYLKAADVSLTENLSVSKVQDFVGGHGNSEIEVGIEREGHIIIKNITPTDEVFEDKFAIGIAMDLIGEIKLPAHEAVYKGFVMTGQMIRDITIGLGLFIGQAFTGQADLDSVAGPVGIVSLVDDASNFGLVYLLGFTAFISLNLAVLNLVPFPALDGGRLLFILIEGITRKQIKPSVANTINFVGFAILILLMIIVTVSDVIKLFN